MASISGQTFANGTSGGLNLTETTGIYNSLFVNNSNGGHGGAISSYGRELTVQGTTFSGNSTGANGGAIYINKNLTVTDSLFVGNCSNLSSKDRLGGAVYVQDNTVSISGSTFKGNNSYGNGDNGAIFGLRSNISISNSRFLSSTDTIFISTGAKVTFKNSNVINAAVKAAGDGAYISENAEFTFSNLAPITIAAIGGTIKSVTFDGQQTVTLTDQDLSEADVTVTADLLTKYQFSGGKFVIADKVALAETITVNGVNVAIAGGQVTLGGETFTFGFENKQLTVAYSGKQHAIYAPEAIGGVIIDGKLYKGTYVEKNLSGNSGLAIAQYSGRSVIADALVANNTNTGSHGGAVYLNGSVLTVSGSTFANNSTAYHGGAICAYDNVELSVINTLFTGNNCNVSANVRYGGAIYSNNKNNIINISGSTFTGNKAYNNGANGGAIHVSGGNAKIENSYFMTATDVISNADRLTFAGVNTINAAVTGAGKFTADNAGFVFSNYTPISIAAIDGTIKSVTFDGSQTVTFSNQDLSDVTITVTADLLTAFAESPFVIASGIAAMGEVITVNGKTVTLDEACAIGNGMYTFVFDAENKKFSVAYDGVAYNIYAPEAISGAAVNGEVYRGNYIGTDLPAESITENSVISGIVSSNALVIGNDADEVFTGITGATFSGIAESSAVKVNSFGSVAIENSLFDNNAANDGGALTAGIGNGASAVITGSTLSRNHADSLGGAIKLNRNYLEVTDSLIVNNSADNNGGAINVNEGTAVITATEFSGNVSATSGGAIFVRGDDKNPQITLKDGIFTENSAANGGALYIGSGETNISGTEFNKNTAAGEGGAIWSAGKLIVSDSVFSGNKNTASGSNGGAIRTVGNTEISNSLFADNTTDYYGGAISMGNGTLKITGSTFSGNICTTRGGGALHVHNNAVTINDSLFVENSSGKTNYGGAIYLNETNASATITGSTFSGNSSPGAGGAIFVYKGTANISGSTFAQSVDTIVNSAGKVNFSDRNVINAAVSGNGTFNVTENAILFFDNTTEIDVAKLTFYGNNSIVLSGEKINFTGLDASKVAITVDGSGYESGAVIATGVTAIGAYTINNKSNAYLGLAVVDNNLVLKEIDAQITVGSDLASYTGSGVTIMDGGKVGTFFADKSGADNIATKISGGKVESNLVGGAYVAAGNNATVNSVELLIGGTAEVAAKVYAGGYLYGNGTDSAEAQLTVKSVNITIDGGAVSTNMYGGAHARQNGNASVAEVNITVTAGNHGRIYAGGWAEKGAVSSVGTATVIISGGTVDYLYGGGANADGTTTVGATTITIENSALVNTVFMSGRYGYSSVSDTVTLNYNSTTGMKRLSGVSSAGVDNAENTVVNVLSNLTADLIDYVDKFVISENCTLTANDAFYLGNRLENGETDGFTTFEITAAESGWEVISGLSLDDFDYAKFIVNGSELTAWGDVDTLELGGCALTRSDVDKDGKYTIAITK